MFNVDLDKNEEIIFTVDNAKIDNGNLIDVYVLITNLRMIIYQDVNKQLEYMEVMRLVEAVKILPNYEKQLEINYQNIKSVNYSDNLTILETKDGNILKIISKEIMKYFQKK